MIDSLRDVIQGRVTPLGQAWEQYIASLRAGAIEAMLASEPGTETEQARGAVLVLDQILRDLHTVDRPQTLDDEPDSEDSGDPFL